MANTCPTFGPFGSAKEGVCDTPLQPGTWQTSPASADAPEAGKLLPGTRHPYQPKLRCGRSRLADLQAELEYNQRLIADFGTQKNVGDWQQGEFSTTGGVKWFAVGRGQSPRGLKKQEQRPDYIVIDDLAGATR